MSDPLKMAEYLGTGKQAVQVRNRLVYDGIGSMEELDQKASRMGADKFDLYLRELRNVGEVGVGLIYEGLAKYRSENPVVTKYDVWTRNDKPEWLARNAGCSDVRLVLGVSHNVATVLMKHLVNIYGDTNVEIHPTNKPPSAGTVGTGA